ncbi:hypothetical protein B0H14DRAFT_2616525 [Mycena olivaceomarginata]|nr:hypothetical protein B0H14DRAFT_2616525 [Mycena olivaceomarginata]
MILACKQRRWASSIACFGAEGVVLGSGDSEEDTRGISTPDEVIEFGLVQSLVAGVYLERFSGGHRLYTSSGREDKFEVDLKVQNRQGRTLEIVMQQIVASRRIRATSRQASVCRDRRSAGFCQGDIVFRHVSDRDSRNRWRLGDGEKQAKPEIESLGERWVNVEIFATMSWH